MSKCSAEETSRKPICYQAGYLPVPLRHVPLESLAQLEVYLYNTQARTYSLYRHRDLSFRQKDYQRLLDSGVEFVYVSVQDHQAYYRTMEKTLQEIMKDPRMQKEKKSEILYSTSMELAQQLLGSPPGREEIERTSQMAQATVQMIMNDRSAFEGLFEVFNHDFYTAAHMVNVCSMAISVACKMGLVDQHILQAVGTGGLLHDIGKIFIPDDILNSNEQITSDQYELIQTHVQRGIDHLSQVAGDLPKEVFAIVSEHHERMDGSGYPKGLKRDAISPVGRLAGIVDTFEAMTSVRPYRERTFTMAESLEEIEKNAPEKYDLEITRAFASMIETALAKTGEDEQTVPDGKDKTTAGEPRVISSRGQHKHSQYYFRIPVNVSAIEQRDGQLALGRSERMIAHRISCSGMGLLSPHVYPIDRNIYISAPQFEKIKLMKLTGKVVQCQDHGGGWFTLEVQFHQTQSADRLVRIRSVTNVQEVSPLLDTQ